MYNRRELYFYAQKDRLYSRLFCKINIIVGICYMFNKSVDRLLIVDRLRLFANKERGSRFFVSQSSEIE